MHAAYYSAPGILTVEKVPIPEIDADEMLMRVRSCSICGTDLRIFRHGHFKIATGTRRVLGHEMAGEIAKVGPLVKGFTVGMPVSVAPNIGCGICEFCRDGYNNMCPDYEAFGVSLDGGFQEYVRIPGIAIRGGNIFPLDRSLDFGEACLVEPLSCTYNCLRSVQTTHNDVVLIVGAGPIGILHLLLNKLAGAKKVMAADVRDDRLASIRGFGADVTINSANEDLAQAVMRETGGRGADVIITAVSVPEIQAQAVELLSTHGRVNFFAGLGEGVKVPVNTNRIHYRGLNLVGTTGSTHSDYSRSLALVTEGRIRLDKMITARFGLEEISNAFGYASRAEGLKAVIQFDA